MRSSESNEVCQIQGGKRKKAGCWIEGTVTAKALLNKCSTGMRSYLF
jgi:hypothetical protein